jgi:hypothetical protein
MAKLGHKVEPDSVVVTAVFSPLAAAGSSTPVDHAEVYEYEYLCHKGGAV